MSIAGNMLVAGSALLYATHSTETVTIAGTDYACIVMASAVGNDLELGGFTNQDFHRLAIERADISTIPTEGNAVTFRSTSYRVASVERDDAEANIVVVIQPTTGKGMT